MLGWYNMKGKDKSPFLEVVVELNGLLNNEVAKFATGGHGDIDGDREAQMMFQARMQKVIETAAGLSNKLLIMNNAIYGENKKLLEVCEQHITTLDGENKTEHIVEKQLAELRKVTHKLSQEPKMRDELGDVYEGICRVHNLTVKSVEQIEKYRKIAQSDLDVAKRLRTDENFLTHKK